MPGRTPLSLSELESGLEDILRSPKQDGNLVMIVRRPDEDVREVLDKAGLALLAGLVGDNWKLRGSANPDRQLTMMNSRVIALLARSPERWALAGDQLFVDLDLGEENLPAGSRLGIGTAIIEVTAKPHTGCAKFTARFGEDATRFVNSRRGGDCACAA